MAALPAVPVVDTTLSDAESEGADWDALDLDEIALPGQKSVKEMAAEKVRQPRTMLQSALKALLQLLYSVHAIGELLGRWGIGHRA